MSLKRHNKAMVMGFIIGTALVLVSGVALVGVWKLAFSEAEGEMAERLCRYFNSGRTKGKVGSGPLQFNLVPRACKTLEKEIPSEDYDNTVEGTMLEMSKLIAKCWWMWLEGEEDNIFGTRWPFSKNRCFICYSFNIKKEIDSFQGKEFETFLSNTIYIPEDTSDRCNYQGGGWCRPKCWDDEKKIASNRCEKDEEGNEQICCNKNLDCENKGGICRDLCRINQKEYKGWSCKADQKCCIEKDNLLTYTDYVQRYMGEGVIIIGVDEFQPLKETYAVTYVSKTSLGFWKSFIIGWGLKYITDATFGSEEGVNAIIVSKLNEVDDKCAIEADVAGD